MAPTSPVGVSPGDSGCGIEWSHRHDLFATGTQLVASDPNPPQDHRFYRIVQAD